jgi:hypothetical protein
MHLHISSRLGTIRVHNTVTEVVNRDRKISETGQLTEVGGFLGSVKARKTGQFCYRAGPVFTITAVNRPGSNGI